MELELSKKQETSPNPNIHEDLLTTEILPRLPPNSLIRFQIVSKHWLSTISSPKFVKLQLQRSKTNHFYHGILVKKDLTFSIVSYTYNGSHKDLSIHRLNLSLDRQSFPSGSFSLVGSCNGLVCLWLHSKENSICVCNPLTRECRKIPKPSIKPKQVRPNYSLWVFTYIPSLGDYKLVIISHPIYKIGFRVHALTLKSSRWDEYDSILPRFNNNWSFYDVQGPTLGIVLTNVNIISHWLIYQWSESGSRDMCILGFDMETETFNEVPMPPGITWRLTTCTHCCLSTINDNLCIAFPSDHRRKHDSLEVWELESYGDVGSWKNLLNVMRTAFRSVESTPWLHNFTTYRSSKGVNC